MSPKVCLISGSFPNDKCGVGDYTRMLAKTLSEHGIDLSIITSCKNLKKSDDLNIYNQVNDWSIFNVREVLKQIEKIKPDIVHIQYPTKAYERKVLINILPAILKLKGYKVITTLHEYNDCSTLGKIRSDFNIMFSDYIIVVDPNYKVEMKNKRLFKSKQVNYINIASNIPKSVLSKEQIIEKKDLIIRKRDKKVMGYFGFVSKPKGIESIIKSMKLLKDSGELKSVLLMIAELKADDKYHKSLLELIEELDLKEDVIITGYLEDLEVSNYIKMCDFIVLPFVYGVSTKNGSMLAAVQEGKKVITTRNEGFNESIKNLYFIDKYDDINQLVNKIKKIQEESLNENEFENINFTWYNIAYRHVKVYEKILGGNND